MHVRVDERTATSQTKRERETETAGAGGEVCADLTGRLLVAYSGSEYLTVALRRRHALDLLGADDHWLREHVVLHTTTSAYDPNANSLVEESVGARKRRVRCLLRQSHAPNVSVA